MPTMKIQYVDIYKLIPATRNPKLHALEDIVASIREYGFREPIVVDNKTKRIVIGHGRLEALIMIHKASESPPDGIKVVKGTWMAPTINVIFTNEAAAESYALTANRLVEKGGWHIGQLEEMLQTLEPIGFDLLKELEHEIDTSIATTPDVEEILQTTRKSGLIPTNQSGTEGVGPAKVDSTGLHLTSTKEPTKFRCDFDEIPGNLEGVFRIEEGHIFSSSSKLGIPDLLSDMILPEIPKPIKTWGGIKETPDDGKSYYFYNFGSTPSKGVPYERALASWYTVDSHVKTFLETPAYRVGKLLMARIVGAVVPDVSLWEGNPLVLHMYSIYQAQWLGRFMQEAGLKVIPRFEYFLPEIQEFSLAGIPNKPATLATQLHTTIADENIPWLQKCLMTGLRKLQPSQFLVYVSERGAQVIQDIENELPIQELILLPTAKKVRRTESRAEVDPYLKELRKRKRGWEGKKNDEV